MKFLIVILAVTALAYADPVFKVKSPKEIFEIREECIKETPTLSEEQIEKIRVFELADEEPVRKYLLCSIKKIDVFSEDHGGYSAERVAQQFKVDLDEAEVIALVKGCADNNEQGSPADVWAYRGNRCLEETKLGEKVRTYLKNAVAEGKKE